MKIFISGPMTGIENYNFPKFDLIENQLKSAGFEVCNPARISRKFKEIDINSDRNIYDKMVYKQIQEEKKCDAILLLDGWQRANGVKRELELALLLDMKIILESELQEFINANIKVWRNEKENKQQRQEESLAMQVQGALL